MGSLALDQKLIETWQRCVAGSSKFSGTIRKLANSLCRFKNNCIASDVISWE